MKEYIKRHKKTIILVVIFALLLVLVIKVKDILIPNEKLYNYGSRLNEIDEYPISEDIYKKIDDEYAKNTNIKKTTHRVQGKIINFYVTLDDKATINDAKKLGDVIIKAFDEKTLSYYSIQVYMLKDNEALNNFPIVGMKNPKSTELVWTKDREITKEEEEVKNEE